MSSQSYPTKKVAYINASQVTSDAKDGSKNIYIRSKTFNIDEVRATLGTPYAMIKVFKRKSGKNLKPEDRLVIIEESEKKYMPGSSNEQGPGPRSPLPQNDDDEVI